MTRLGVRAALVDGELVAGDVEIDGPRIGAVGAQPAGRSGIAVPGFVDLQVNGFGGVDFLTTDVAEYRVAACALASTGVTAYQPTVVTAPPGDMLAAIGRARQAQLEVGAPRILGVHVEGPFLATRWKGAHDERWLLPPDLDLAARMLSAGPVGYMTIAPELPGGFDLLDLLVSAGVVVSLGHTDADARTAHAAFDRGARALTHLHNAHRRFTARDPGVGAVALVRPDVVVGVIADLVHLAAETVMLAWSAAPGRVALVTDAIAAAPARRGTFTFGGREIDVDDGEARSSDGVLAGSVLTMDQAVRNLVALGVPLGAAVAGATSVPAGLVGRAELGTLRPGTPADIAVLDDRHRVTRTVVDGHEVWSG
jgi:N-acetylglucosamine-6-phosphate deacetylase